MNKIIIASSLIVLCCMIGNIECMQATLQAESPARLAGPLKKRFNLGTRSDVSSESENSPKVAKLTPDVQPMAVVEPKVEIKPKSMAQIFLEKLESNASEDLHGMVAKHIRLVSDISLEELLFLTLTGLKAKRDERVGLESVLIKLVADNTQLKEKREQLKSAVEKMRAALVVLNQGLPQAPRGDAAPPTPVQLPLENEEEESSSSSSSSSSISTAIHSAEIAEAIVAAEQKDSSLENEAEQNSGSSAVEVLKEEIAMLQTLNEKLKSDLETAQQELKKARIGLNNSKATIKRQIANTHEKRQLKSQVEVLTRELNIAKGIKTDSPSKPSNQEVKEGSES